MWGLQASCQHFAACRELAQEIRGTQTRSCNRSMHKLRQHANVQAIHRLRFTLFVGMMACRRMLATTFLGHLLSRWLKFLCPPPPLECLVNRHVSPLQVQVMYRGLLRQHRAEPGDALELCSEATYVFLQTVLVLLRNIMQRAL